MLKSNRLINDFRKQEKYSIWKHIDAMAVNYAVYSVHKMGVEPYLTGKDVYVYCNEENLVVVCVDCYQKKEKPTYEEGESIEPLIMLHGREPQESVVWQLKETMRLMRRRLCLCRFDLNVYGILLTEAKITNADNLEDMWKANHIKVFEGFKDLRHRKASVNTDEGLQGRIYCTAALDSGLDAEMDAANVPTEPQSSLDDEDDFDRMLQDFIDGQLELPSEDKQNLMDDITETDDEEGKTEDEEGKTEDEGIEDNPVDTEDNMDNVQIPDEEIEQNQTLSIKVKILLPLSNPREELDKLVGCKNIKQRMDELVALTSYNKLMREQFPENKQHKVSLHSVFFGRPGTGKTTVCKIYGSLLRQAGALSIGHVVVCDRGTFIGTLWGDEERAVRQVVEKAKGGVLMIDEAYLLNGKNENDPGRMVVQLLMNILADESQRDIAVVLCGYKEEMIRMLECNPGLESRFPNKFEFQDFTIDELLDITQHRIQEYEYQFTPEAWEKYRRVLSQAYQVRDPQTWGNARFVANQLDCIYIQHAARCVKQLPPKKRDLLLLTPEDIVPINIPCQKPKIGF